MTAGSPTDLYGDAPLPQSDRSERLRTQQIVARRWFLASLAILLLAYVLQHTSGTSTVSVVGWTLPPLCFFSSMFGRACPGCGLTRSFILAADGQWAQAHAVHPLGVASFLLVAAQLPFRAKQWIDARAGRLWRRIVVWELSVLCIWQFALTVLWLVRTIQAAW
jgi:hypothetical protein